MRVAVCIKQVPDTEARLQVGADGRWIEEGEIPFAVDSGGRLFTASSKK